MHQNTVPIVVSAPVRPGDHACYHLAQVQVCLLEASGSFDRGWRLTDGIIGTCLLDNGL